MYGSNSQFGTEIPFEKCQNKQKIIDSLDIFLMTLLPAMPVYATCIFYTSTTVHVAYAGVSYELLHYFRQEAF